MYPFFCRWEQCSHLNKNEYLPETQTKKQPNNNKNCGWLKWKKESDHHENRVKYIKPWWRIMIICCDGWCLVRKNDAYWRVKVGEKWRKCKNCHNLTPHRAFIPAVKHTHTIFITKRFDAWNRAARRRTNMIKTRYDVCYAIWMWTHVSVCITSVLCTVRSV